MSYTPSLLTFLSFFAAGWIVTNKVLDRETHSSYWLTVYARDRAAVPRSSWCSVLIELLDVNDNIPQTFEPAYYPSVTENSPDGTSVIQLQARDLDADGGGGGGGGITYEIAGGNPQGFFRINRHSGRGAGILRVRADCNGTRDTNGTVLIKAGESTAIDVRYKFINCITIRYVADCPFLFINVAISD